jgi:hypothetical protein
MDPRTERAGKNEAAFREVNERINDLHRERTSEYLCECGFADCVETVQMTVAEYEEVRTDPTRFILRPGHEIPHIELVVTRNEGFLVVQKKAGEAAEIAVELDPRS